MIRVVGAGHERTCEVCEVRAEQHPLEVLACKRVGSDCETDHCLRSAEPLHLRSDLSTTRCRWDLGLRPELGYSLIAARACIGVECSLRVLSKLAWTLAVDDALLSATQDAGNLVIRVGRLYEADAAAELTDSCEYTTEHALVDDALLSLHGEDFLTVEPDRAHVVRWPAVLVEQRLNFSLEVWRGVVQIARHTLHAFTVSVTQTVVPEQLMVERRRQVRRVLDLVDHDRDVRYAVHVNECALSAAADDRVTPCKPPYDVSLNVCRRGTRVKNLHLRQVRPISHEIIDLRLRVVNALAAFWCVWLELWLAVPRLLLRRERVPEVVRVLHRVRRTLIGGFLGRIGLEVCNRVRLCSWRC